MSFGKWVRQVFEVARKPTGGGRYNSRKIYRDPPAMRCHSRSRRPRRGLAAVSFVARRVIGDDRTPVSDVGLRWRLAG